MIDIHAFGGYDMMAAARQAVERSKEKHGQSFSQ